MANEDRDMLENLCTKINNTVKSLLLSVNIYVK